MKIGIIGAMKEEIDYFLRQGTSFEKSQKAHLTIYEGKWHGHHVVMTQCGVGKVNGAVTTQILIDHYSIEAALFTGVAGALDPELEIGDLVISEDCIQHDLDGSPLGFKRGEVPMFSGRSQFKADELLVNIAFEEAVSLKDGNVKKGRVLSGDQFIADSESVDELYTTFNGHCVEMEGAAVAYTAMVNEVPFVIIRSISDKANGEAADSFTIFVEKTAVRSATLVEKMLQRIS
ncbi:5'-methylthioadenosine/adenosylhomocysteine nucleosidase [Alteribacter populi]|uniref:5'-methylthioadenosine/adenosylhomocysteine nucleosidase n=1 Tax=Alteribacter populi TaxID=2011011 RepID=UPI000BBA63B5|nr:5'-methylthioadenosine/adenosylhomocysteine nucleosidase [Alteribacter populi]